MLGLTLGAAHREDRHNPDARHSRQSAMDEGNEWCPELSSPPSASTLSEALPTPRTVQVTTLQAELAATQAALEETRMLVSSKEQEALFATMQVQQVGLRAPGTSARFHRAPGLSHRQML